MVVKLVQKKHNNYNHIMITIMIITITITRSIYMAILNVFCYGFINNVRLYPFNCAHLKALFNCLQADVLEDIIQTG